MPRRLEPILAAGGIVAGVRAGEIAIVRRRRYPGEIGLPKGKAKTAFGETIVHAAEREVAEEIGYPVRAVDFAGITHYFAKSRPKVVFYYHMAIIGEGGPIDTQEIEAVAWLTPGEAIVRLTHAEDRRLIAALFALPD